jgi:3-oxoacyl-[acyl-carrier-protein] synthase II
MRTERRRAVITGMGVIAANGCDLKTFWKTIREGTSAGRTMDRFDPGASPTLIAAQVEDFDSAIYMEPKMARRLETSNRFGVAAAVLARNDSGLDFAQIDPDRAGVVEGTTASANESAQRGAEAFQRRGYRGISPNSLINGYSGSGSGEIAQELSILGHAVTLSSGSASGNDTLGYALQMIRNEEVDVMVAGGSEAPLTQLVWAALTVGRIMSRRNDRPKEAMRPFDKTRDGILLGEGGAYVVVEELTHALSRGARIYAELLGHGRACEAYHPVAPHPDGIGPYRAMQKALRNAEVDLSEVDYINAHGTATEANDVVETKAIKKFFGSHAYQMGISSTKPVTGHLLGAAGALETVVCALAVYHQEMPLTLNLQQPDPACDLDYIKGKSRPYPVRVALNLSCGFGGKNSCLVLRRYPS